MESTEKRFRGIEMDLDLFVGKSMESDAKGKPGNYLRDRVRKLRDFDRDTTNSLIDTALDAGQLTEREGLDLAAISQAAGDRL